MIYIENKKYSNIFKKLVFILILFTFGINVAKAATISFESHGGPDVDSYEISTDKLGELPSPTMDGYLFDGWYKEATYLNKVSSKTDVNGDMTLHARWVYNPFPFLYPYHAEDFNADMTLEKRQRVFYYYNANLCEKSCTFVDLDINTYQAICDCPVKNEINLDITRQDLFEYIEKYIKRLFMKKKYRILKA